MSDISPDTGDLANLAPRFTSVKNAAQYLGVSTWQMYELLNDKDRPVESQYLGRKRLVDIESLRRYADNLPTVRPETESA